MSKEQEKENSAGVEEREKDIVVLSKKDILRTVHDAEPYYISKLDAHVKLRPLSDGEWSEIESIQASGIKANYKDLLGGKNLKDLQGMSKEQIRDMIEKEGDFDFELGPLTKSQKKADCLAASYGMTIKDEDGNIEEEWTVEEVNQLPPGVPEEIAKIVYRISGIEMGTNESGEEISGKSVKKFRGQ